MLVARGFARVFLCRAIAPLALLWLFFGVAYADTTVTITASIDGNTVNYTVMGLEPEKGYVVIIEHQKEGGQSSTHVKTSDESGAIKGSGTPGNSEIKPGDFVTVTVKDMANNTVASKSFRKDEEPSLLGKFWRFLKSLVGL